MVGALDGNAEGSLPCINLQYNYKLHMRPNMQEPFSISFQTDAKMLRFNAISRALVNRAEYERLISETIYLFQPQKERRWNAVML